MSDTKTDRERRQIAAFDEDTFVETNTADEIFDVSSKLDFQRPLRNAPPIPTLPVKSATGAATAPSIPYVLPPSEDVRVAGFVAAVLVFSLISILCYFFAR